MTERDEQESVSFAAIRGSIVTFGTQWGARIIGLGSSVVLARLLTPSDFGIVAVAMTVPAMLNALSSVSPWAYLLRVEVLDHEKLDTAFTISVAKGIFVSLLVFVAALLAPLLGADPRLPAILYGLALSPLIESFANPRIVEYARAMDFGFISRRQISTKIAGAIAGIIVAIMFRTYWALVIGLLARSVTWVGVSFFVKPYRPRFSLAAWRNILGFSIWLSFRVFVETLGNQGDRLIVARWTGIASVGNFSVAKDFAWMTAAEFFDTVRTVMYPAFGKFREKPKELQANVLEAYGFLVAVALPWTIGAALVGPQAVILIYGAKWAPAAAVVTPLALALAFQSTDTIASALVMAAGNPKSLMIRSTVTTILRLSILTVGLVFFDLPTAIWLLVPVGLVGAGINMALLRDLARLPATAFARSTWRSWFAVAVMMAAIAGVDHGIPQDQGSLALVMELAARIAVGATSYTAAHLLLWELVGRPQGPETRILKIVGGVWNRIRPRATD